MEPDSINKLMAPLIAATLSRRRRASTRAAATAFWEAAKVMGANKLMKVSASDAMSYLISRRSPPPEWRQAHMCPK